MADIPERSPLIESLPPFMRQFREMVEIMRIEDLEMDTVNESVDYALRQSFVSDCDEYGIRRYEQLYKLTPKATDTLEDRRFRIYAKLSEQLPYTIRRLRQILVNLCGEGNFSAEIVEGTYILRVRVDLEARSNYDVVSDLLKRVVPVNLYVDLSLLYNIEVCAACAAAPIGCYMQISTNVKLSGEIDIPHGKFTIQAGARLAETYQRLEVTVKNGME